MQYWILSHFLSWAINFGTEVFRYLVKNAGWNISARHSRIIRSSDNSWLCCCMVTANYCSRPEISHQTSLGSLLMASQEKDQWELQRSITLYFAQNTKSDHSITNMPLKRKKYYNSIPLSTNWVKAELYWNFPHIFRSETASFDHFLYLVQQL